MKNFFSDGISMDEFKVSTIVIVLMIVALFIGSMTFFLSNGTISSFPDIPTNWLVLIQTLIYAVAGVNGLRVVDNIVGKRKEKNKEDSYNDRI